MVKENLRAKTLRLPNINERIQYTYFNQAMHESNYSKRQFESVEQQKY